MQTLAAVENELQQLRNELEAVNDVLHATASTTRPAPAAYETWPG
ncbi:hypothetical protein AB0F17_34920 [Nonomuraea sp. NPDC026600]